MTKVQEKSTKQKYKKKVQKQKNTKQKYKYKSNTKTKPQIQKQKYETKYKFKVQKVKKVQNKTGLYRVTDTESRCADRSAPSLLSLNQNRNIRTLFPAYSALIPLLRV
eukprot:TRINITY_DN186_c0_g1_i1.p1 TRINITY_DN186_c0_g1~~TRINITY_DN186_c0_g1_i1.p1  ORF type:complete len:126 (+),score=58.54 TRINITY_DN186_c0_g1_i1:57-380(+)